MQVLAINDCLGFRWRSKCDSPDSNDKLTSDSSDILLNKHWYGFRMTETPDSSWHCYWIPDAHQDSYNTVTGFLLLISQCIKGRKSALPLKSGYSKFKCPNSFKLLLWFWYFCIIKLSLNVVIWIKVVIKCRYLN